MSDIYQAHFGIPYNAQYQPALGGLGTAPVMTPAGQFLPPPGFIGLPQSPDPPDITNEMLLNAITVSNDAFLNMAFRTPQYHPDALIRDKGWDVIDDMRTMAAYWGPLRLKMYATLYKEREVQPRYMGKMINPDHPQYDRAMQAVDICNYVISNIYNPITGMGQDFREVLWYMLGACHHGFSVQEKQWRILTDGPYKGKMGLQRIIPRRPKQITFNLDVYTNEIKTINNYTPMGGWQQYLPPRKFLIYTYHPIDGLVYGVGDSRACYKHVFAINELMRLWGVCLQRHGGGFLKGTVNSPSDLSISNARKVLESVQSGGVLITTPAFTADIMNTSGGIVEVFAQALGYHEGCIVSNILGQSLTTRESRGNGGYNLGMVHQNTQEYFISHPRTDVEQLIPVQLFRDIIEYNLGVGYLDVIPGLTMGVWDHDEIQVVANYVKTFAEGGILVPADIVSQRSGLQNLEIIPPISVAGNDPVQN